MYLGEVTTSLYWSGSLLLEGLGCFLWGNSFLLACPCVFSSWYMFLFSSPLRFLSFVYALYTLGLGPFLSLCYLAYSSKKIK